MSCGGSNSGSSSGGCSDCTSMVSTGNHQTPSYGCNGACASTCGSCSTGCMSCTGTCSTSCSGSCDSTCTNACDGCYGCTNTAAACAGCGSGCASSCSGCSSCSGTCNTGCYGSCRQSCSSCASNCSSACAGYCEGCGSGCASSCSGCSGGCTGTCTTSCGTGCGTNCTGVCGNLCTGECSGGCNTTCSGNCDNGCTNTCKDTCTGTCESTCASNCSGECTGGCKSSCTNACAGTSTTAACGYICAGGCISTCSTACSESCAAICTGACKEDCTGTCTDKCTSCTGTCWETCTGSNSLITNTDELEQIIVQVRNEIYRRSGFNEDGDYLHQPEFRHYCGPILSEPDDTLFVIDSSTDIIRVGHGIPVIDMLLKICDFADARLVRELDLLPGIYHKEKLLKFVKFLRDTPFDAPVSHCRGACTGLCQNNCTTACSGGCINECASCSELCSGKCSGQCTGCSESCGTSCGMNCGSDCSGKVSGCSGCSSGCSGCTGCTNTCDGTCATTCKTTCHGCTAGCYGNSGLHDTCGGCGAKCTTGCGGIARAVASSPKYRSIELYHNGYLYGTLSTIYHDNSEISESLSVGDIKLPTFNIIEGRFPLYNGGIPAQRKWVDSSDGTRYPIEDSLPTAIMTESDSTVTKLYSSTVRELYLYSRVEVGLSFDVNEEAVTLVNQDKNISIITDTIVFITAIDSSGRPISGAHDSSWNLKVNNVYEALPYSAILHKGDTVSMYGDNVSFNIIRHIDHVAKKTLTVPLIYEDNMIKRGIGIVPFCKCSEIDISFDSTGHVNTEIGVADICNLADNPHAKVTSDLIVRNGGQITDVSNSIPLSAPESITRTVGYPSRLTDKVTVTVETNEYKEILADGSYSGIVYNAGFELYESYDYGTGIPYAYSTDGRTDSDFNVVLYDMDSKSIVEIIPLNRKNTSFEEYEFIIPKIDGYSHATNAPVGTEFESRIMIFDFDTPYSIYGRVSIVLILVKE